MDWLTDRLCAVPGFTVRTDRLTFNRWLARDFALRVQVPATVGRSGPVRPDPTCLLLSLFRSDATPGRYRSACRSRYCSVRRPGWAGSDSAAAFRSTPWAGRIIRSRPCGPGGVAFYLGEGAPPYAAGLGTVSLCPLPTYLRQAGGAQRPHLLELDKRLMYGQILTFAQTIEALDAAPHPPSLGHGRCQPGQEVRHLHARSGFDPGGRGDPSLLRACPYQVGGPCVASVILSDRSVPMRAPARHAEGRPQ